MKTNSRYNRALSYPVRVNIKRIIRLESHRIYANVALESSRNNTEESPNPDVRVPGVPKIPRSNVILLQNK